MQNNENVDFSHEISALMPELRKRFQMDKMLERTIAACVNDKEVPGLLDTHHFSNDVMLGLAFYHSNSALNESKDVHIIKVKDSTSSGR